MDPAPSAKTYSSILKTLLNNKKIPCIPPFFKKAELFNSLGKQCSIIQNSSKLPLALSKKTQKSLFQVLLSIVMILQQLFVVLVLTRFMATIC